ncbi:hypothetical protein IAT38_005291 [Cryptococcus sp. DSM 104549]
MLSSIFTTALFAGAALASPILVERDLKPYVSDITIHESCNSTQRRMLETALADTFEVATFAKEYVTTNGAQDPIFLKYFGNDTGSYSQVVGIWEAFLTSNKDGVILRCDNPDGNCGQAGWRGHWRGDNATSETVICDLSYTDRLYNQNFCMGGWSVAKSPISTYWSIDLIHRFFHVPATTNGLVGHYAEDLAEVLELAEHNATFAAIDSDALQYFAAHVYALEVAKGGDECIGTIEHTHEHTESSSSAAAPASTSSSAAAPASTSEAASATSEAAAAETGDCHTHADGTVHCV